MKRTIGTLYLGAMLIVCSGCAHDIGGGKELGLSNADVTSASCATAGGERVYRNPYLRARHIGEQACVR